MTVKSTCRSCHAPIPLRVTTHEAEASIRELMDTGAELWIALYALPKKDGER